MITTTVHEGGRRGTNYCVNFVVNCGEGTTPSTLSRTTSFPSVSSVQAATASVGRSFLGHRHDLLVQSHRHPPLDQMLHLDILVNIRPVQHPPVRIDIEAPSLFHAGSRQPRIAPVRCGDPATIRQTDREIVFSDQETDRLRQAGLFLNRRSAHATSLASGSLLKTLSGCSPPDLNCSDGESGRQDHDRRKASPIKDPVSVTIGSAIAGARGLRERSP